MPKRVTTRRHGHSYIRTRTYRSWQSMIRRCTQPNAHNYARYGGRGISVCERWKLFDNFLADMGVAPDGMTLERKDVNGNYEPGNCRWATLSEQQNNRRGHKHYFVDGKWMGFKQLAEHLGVSAYMAKKKVASYQTKIVGEE